jgi:hypothetical protein
LALTSSPTFSGTVTATTVTSPAATALTLQSAGTTAITIDTSQNATFAGTVNMSSSFLRNRIINGNMVISQYNGTSSVTPTANVYNIDRWTAQLTQASKFSVQQVAVSNLTGFSYSQNFTVVTPYTIGSGDYFGTEQRIEGYNIADLAYGTASAKTTTLSFWAYANNAGTYCGSLYCTGSYVFTYTISSANTWQYITVTIPGSTAYAFGSTTNGAGLYVRFTFSAGSAFQTATPNTWVAGNAAVVSGAFNWIGTSGATLYITGVQLEQGTIATPFERPLYSKQLADCQRYCEVIKPANTYSMFGTGNSTSTTGAAVYVPWQTIKRATPTITFSATSDFGFSNSVFNSVITATGLSVNYQGLQGSWISGTVSSGLTANACTALNANNNNNAAITISAEL